MMIDIQGFRTEILRSKDDTFLGPRWEILLYMPQFDSPNWTAIRCTFTRWGARRAAKRLLQQYVPVETIRSND